MVESKVVHPWLKLGICCSLLWLSACSSTTFVYNRMDFVLGWYVDDYVDLTRAQKKQLEQLLQPFLRWHRQQELPRYVALLDDLEARLDRPLSAADLAGLYGDLEAAWFRLEGEALTWLLALGAELSEQQIESFNAHLQKRQREFEEKYLTRSDQEFREESYDSLLDSMQDYLGRLDRDQRGRLRQASDELQRSDTIWLRERAAWLAQLRVFLQRQPGWQQRLLEAIDQRDQTVSAQYRQTYAHNLQVVFSAMADVLDSRSAKQDGRLRRELEDLREDLQSLIDQGLEKMARAA